MVQGVWFDSGVGYEREDGRVMSNIIFAEEYFRDDKSTWPPGAWHRESDKAVWVDGATNLDCMIVRNRLGALCGYVGVSVGHPCFEQSEADVEVHGGITFSNFCDDNETRCHEDRICHVAQAGRPERVWWLGFDCSHARDFCPRWHARGGIGYGEYRDMEYVIREVQRLAQQLKDTV